MDIYIGNLSTNLEEESISTLFGAFGPVIRTTIIKDRDTGISKGFGFVRMHSAFDAQRAIDELNGKTFSGRQMVVYEAKQKSENRTYTPRRERIYEDSDRVEEEELSTEILDQTEYSKRSSDDGLISISFKN